MFFYFIKTVTELFLPIDNMVIYGNIYHILVIIEEHTDMKLFPNPKTITSHNTFIGILLICLAVSALLFWEVAGRELFLMKPVLIAKSDIEKGTVLSHDLFKSVSVPIDALVEDAVAPGDASLLTDKIAAIPIISGAQLSERIVIEPNDAIKPDTSSFVIKNEWIALCTSALRRGDKIELMYGNGEISLGTYEVAFVKDAEGREVIDTSNGISSFRAETGSAARTNPSAPIHHIEVECEWEDYKKILNICSTKAKATLIIVRKDTSLW